MFGVVVKVELPEDGTIERGREELEKNVVPMVKASPGFVSAHWLSPSKGREGLGVMIYQDEQSARQSAERVNPPEGTRLIDVEVREVVASA